MILTTADVSMTDAFSDDGGASGGSKAVGRKNEAGFAGTALFGSAFLDLSEKSDDCGASGGSKAVGRKDEAGFVGTALFGSASLHSSGKIEYHI